MADNKLAKVDSNETDVEKGSADATSVKQVPVADFKDSNNARSTRKVEIDAGQEFIRFRRHWWQIW